MVATENRRRGRLILLALFAIGFIPMMIAWGMVLGGWRPPSITAHGKVLSPPVALNETLKVPSDTTTQQWRLLIVDPACQQACQQRLERLRKMHVALGRHAEELQRVLVSDSKHQELTDPFLQRWLLSNVKPSEQARLTEAVWLVDPNGWLVLSFSLNLPEAQVYEDVLKLIKAQARG
ncbi:hypothetical protein MAQ5080_03419 [Marinomonas aquimarina]|uniref:Transmembrane protein n=1 Tax=Marinomonas aquimarina TaxID=295068 RepID=A0A1A8TPW5_9GAMM|nr:hypothetical protein [Marinomonas aquimarina]SBS36308.1 hypothetical protein MAQ5080_03419 [Marinomonas aquimarina]